MARQQSSIIARIPKKVATTRQANGQANGQSAQDGATADRIVEVKGTWASPSPSPRRDYALTFVDVEVKVLDEVESTKSHWQQCNGVDDLLSTVQSSLQSIGDFWSGRVLVVVPTRSGYIPRTRVFENRFIGCNDFGSMSDRTVFGQRVEAIPAGNHELQTILNGSVLFFARSLNDSQLLNESAVVEEVCARINFSWLSDREPKETLVAYVDGHRNLDSYLPYYNSARALGMKFVIFDRPGTWLAQPAMRHLYEDYIELDMTPNDTFHVRIAEAVKAYGNIDSVTAIASYCLAPVAKAAILLGLPTELPAGIVTAVDKYQTRLIAGGAEPTTLVDNVADLETQMREKTYVPTFPSIVKPGMGTGSELVFRVDSNEELVEGVRRSNSSGKKVLIEAYVNGPEMDVNYILDDGEILFFEISDDFPSPGDDGNMDNDFWENTNILPSGLPENEYAVVRDTLHKVLLKLGLTTGIFHLEGRVQHSSMEYSKVDGIVDLRPKQKSHQARAKPPSCFLIEINPRPPGFPVIGATAATYGIDLYDIHLLRCLGDIDRMRALSKPFESHPNIPNHGRAWSQLVWLRADKGGICKADHAANEFLETLSPKDRALITQSVCIFHRGDRIPDPRPGVVIFGGFYVVASRRSRSDVLRVTRAIQNHFSIPVSAAIVGGFRAQGIQK